MTLKIRLPSNIEDGHTKQAAKQIRKYDGEAKEETAAEEESSSDE